MPRSCKPLAILAAVLLGCSPRVEPTCVTIHASPPELSVHMAFAAAGTDTVELEIGPWAGVDTFGEGIRDLAAIVAGDTIAVSRAPATDEAAPDAWRIPTAGMPFEVSYRVENDKTSFAGTGRSTSFLPTLLDDLVFSWGHAYLLRPRVDRLVRAPVVAVAAGDEVLASWDPAYPFDGMSSLMETLVVAGDVSVQRIVVGTAEVTIAVHGRAWRFDVSDLADRVGTIVRAHARYMGGYPVSRLLVVLTEGTADNQGGTAIERAIAVFADPERELLDARSKVLPLVAHEHFHLWNGRLLTGDPSREEGYYKWFQEGVTEYVAHLTLLREELVDASTFIGELNRWIIEYIENPVALTATADTLESRYWSTRDHQRLPYVKGALLAWLVDTELHSLPAGRGNLAIEHWIRAALDRSDEENGRRYYDVDVLIDALVTTSDDETLGDLAGQLALTAASLPIERAASALDITSETRTLFELGFRTDWSDVEKGATIVEVLPGSAAVNAGVREGDVLDGIDLWHGDPTRDARFRLRRGTDLVDVVYRPQTLRRVTLIDDTERSRAGVRALARR